MAIGIGLLLDITGAFILAIPDLPSAQNYFFPGKLKTSLGHLQMEKEGREENELVAPDTEEKLLEGLILVDFAKGITVAEVVQSDQLQTIGDFDPPTNGFYELRQSIKKIRSPDEDNVWNDVFGFKTIDDGEEIRSIIMYVECGLPKKKLEGPYHMVLQPVEDRIEEYEARFRRIGLALLIMGSAFQGISVWFS